MCGITGFIGKRVNIEKFKILTMWNDSRGKHSCGLYYDNKVHYGVDKNSKMTDFLQVHQMPAKLKNPTIALAHSRSATMGTHTSDNAHPITITKGEDNLLHTNIGEGPYGLIGVHNGRIHNYYDMRLVADKELPGRSFNIDSKVLFGRIFLEQEKPQPVLEAYRGAASIMYTVDNGETLNVFKGAAGDIEERPLFFLQEPEGFYFSSMVEPLLIIKTTDKKVYTINKNHLMQFTKNGYQGKVEVNRAKGMDEEEKKPTTYYSPKSAHRGGINEITEHVDYAPRASRAYGPSEVSWDHNLKILGRLDKEEKGEMIGHMMFRDFRYEFRGRMANGLFHLDSNGCVDEKKGLPYWFFEGIMVSEEGFLTIARRMIESGDDLFEEISMVSRYPVFAVCINDVFRNKTACSLLTYRGEPFTGNIRCAFYSHAYVVKDGKLIQKVARAQPREKFWLDQLWFKNKQGIPTQILRDHKAAIEERVGDDSSLDEGERGGDPIPNSAKEFVQSSLLHLKQPLKISKRHLDSMTGSNNGTFCTFPQRDLADDENVDLLKFLNHEANKMAKDKKALEDLLGEPAEVEVQEEGDIDTSMQTPSDIEEFAEEPNGQNWDNPAAGDDNPGEDEADDYLQSISQYSFEEALENELADIKSDIEELIGKYGMAYKERDIKSDKVFKLLTCAGELAKLIEENIV